MKDRYNPKKIPSDQNVTNLSCKYAGTVRSDCLIFFPKVNNIFMVVHATATTTQTAIITINII